MESSNDIELINSLGVEVVGVSCGLVPLSATSQPRRTWEFEWCAEWCEQFRHARCTIACLSSPCQKAVASYHHPLRPFPMVSS
jgi:hypothetical protein